jgi:outer membrane immunogenic protein
VFAALVAAPAMAADRGVRPVYKTPVPVWSWTGLYVGLNTGGAIGANSTTDRGVFASPLEATGFPIGTNTLFDESFQHAPTGWVFGGQLGYNWQLASNWVVGLEADWQWSSQKGTATVGGCSSPPTAGFFGGPPIGAGFGECLSHEQKLTNFGTARTRVGYVVNESLWYVTGGAAWGTVKDNFAYTSSIDPDLAVFFPGGPFFLPAAAGFSRTKGGWTIGAGVETRLAGAWSLKLEYLYVDLGSTADAFGIALNPTQFSAAALAATTLGVTSTFRFTDNIVRLGLNYKVYAAPASAADLGVRPVFKAPLAVSVWSWTGLYVGLNTGGATGVNSTTERGVFASPLAVGGFPIGTNTLFNESFQHAPTGWVFGGQLGYNWQLASNWVVGLEADWQWSSQKGTATVGGCSSPPTLGFVNGAPFGAGFGECLSHEQKLTNFGTARTRVGYVVNESLWYVTGGAAWGTVKDNFAYTSGIDPDVAMFAPGGPFFLPAAAGFSRTKGGWTIGAGVETRLAGAWSLKLEYLYVDLGNTADVFGIALNPAQFSAAALAATTLGVTSTSRFTDNIVRVGLNYKVY